MSHYSRSLTTSSTESVGSGQSSLVRPSLVRSDKLVHLHCHGTGSALDGLGTPEQQVARLKELGHDACALTDHGEVYFWSEFYWTMRDAGLKPILGLEAYHVQDVRVKETNGRRARKQDAVTGDNESTSTVEYLGDRRAHITLLANSAEGYKNLLALHRESYSKGFHGKPRVDWKTIIKYQRGLTVLSGCSAGMLSRQINAGMHEVAYDWVKYLRNRIEEFYVEIVPCPTLDFAVHACDNLHKIARELNIPWVVTADAHFPRPEDSELQDTMVCANLRTTMADERRTLRIAPYHYICSGPELHARALQTLPHASEDEVWEAIARTRQIADKIDFELPISSGPVYALKPGTTADDELDRWVEAGMLRRKDLGQLPLGELDKYAERVRYELEVIRQKGAANYFLIVADMVKMVRDDGQMCVARGSAGGSLVCWYLGITSIDPIKYGLSFERFLNPDRPTMPDIDIDFPDDYRDQVFHKLIEKWGEDKCGQVASIYYYRTAQAVKDIGGVHGVPTSVTSKLSGLIPKGAIDGAAVKTDGVLARLFDENDEAKAIIAAYPKLALAAAIEGQMRQPTVHACGFVINDTPIHEVVGVAQRAVDDEGTLGIPIVCATKDFVQRHGLLKIDVLGLSTLTVLRDCLAKINRDFDWLEALPLDDAETYEMLSEGYNAGIFQLQGAACARLLRQIRPKNLDDVVNISVLGRPGPLKSGGAQEFVERKYGRQAIPTYHPLVADIVKDTYGVVAYQEQIMRVAREIGGFNWLDVWKVLKVITSTSFGSADMNKYLAAYLIGAKERGVPDEEAYRVWVQCQKAGDYVFNRAHGYQYGVMGYWTAYFKRHYPAIFTAVTASKEDDDVKRVKLFAEFKRVGGRVDFLDPDLSSVAFTTRGPHVLVGGFSNIDGVGPKTAEHLTAGQPYGSWDAMLRAMSPAIMSKVAATKKPDGTWDAAAISMIAPWYVDTTFSAVEREFHEWRGCIPIESVDDAMESNKIMRNFSIGGKVVALNVIDLAKDAKKYGRTPPLPGEPTHRATMVVVDDTGAIEVSIAGWKWRELVSHRDPLQGARGDGIGNGVVVSCDMSQDGTRVYCNDVQVIEPLVVGDSEEIKNVVASIIKQKSDDKKEQNREKAREKRQAKKQLKDLVVDI